MLLLLTSQLKSFHNELLTQLEQKVDLDSRYLSVSNKELLLSVNWISSCVVINMAL